MTEIASPTPRQRSPGPADMLNSAALVERSGLTFRQIDYWCSSGVLHPTISGGGQRGPGRHRRFTQKQADVACVLGRVARFFEEALGSLRGSTDLYGRIAEALMSVEGWPPWILVLADGSIRFSGDSDSSDATAVTLRIRIDE